ncbi:uncharacterized protein HD556DRAFT_1249626 [Suillus plorans]|uniref:Uncharacterized protein n=1 Tax=Suillus plorans TaxID=116603 RepID=A0A9P7AAM7_9AGAM|nr:uncharacterized protein HD556DRAFT_1249626 [Suillus plorans]KAG1785590.1 hypothetical protein HD556DRAFT_1249626 [Suillus plorans]
MSTERKPAPNALWAYLLQKDLPASSDFAATPMVPSMAPVDRTNTSMRMLIHDMQATLEKFSTRVDTLLINVKDAKTEVVNCSRISESEHERVLDEISNSSKKVQTELKACIGAPSQASSLELVQKSQSSAENSIQALNKRIDAIQMVLHIFTTNPALSLVHPADRR